jgi:hypothetical protein
VLPGGLDPVSGGYTYTVPAHYSNIRFELNVMAPGTVWVDDVRIEPLPGE